MSRLLLIGKWLLISVLILSSMAGGILFVLLGTNPGAEFVVRKVLFEVEAQQQLQLSVKDISGTLISGLKLRNVQFDQSDDARSIDLTIKKLAFSWQPLQLWNNRLVVNSLEIENLSLKQTNFGPQTTGATTAIDVDSILGELFSLPVEIEIYAAEFSGVTIAIDDAVYQDMEAEFQLSLNQQNFALEKLRAEYASSRVTGSVGFSSQSRELQTDLQWRTKPDQVEYAGQVKVNGPLTNLHLGHQLKRPIQLLSDGDLQLDFGDLNRSKFNLLSSFDQLSLEPLGQPDVRLAEGQVNVSGSLSNIAMRAGLLLSYDQFAQAKVDTVLQFSEGKLLVEHLNVSSPEIALAAAGDVILDPLQAQFNWDLSRLALAGYLDNDLLGALSGSGLVSLQESGGQHATRLQLTALNGTLNQYPLSARGEISLLDSNLQTLDIEIAAESNTVSVIGNLDPQLSLLWELKAPTLAQLLPGLEGELAGNGTIKGTFANPAVNGALSGKQIVYQADDQRYQFGSIKLIARHENSQNKINLNIGSVKASSIDAELQDLILQLSGTIEQHTLALSTQSSIGSTVLSASGAIDGGSWVGELSAAEFDTRYGHWRLSDATSLSLSASSVDIQQHCWTFINREGVSVCSRLNWQEVGGVTGDLALQNWPLSYFNNLQTLQKYGSSTLTESLLTRPVGIGEVLDAYALKLPEGSVLEGTLSLTAKLQRFTGISTVASANADTDTDTGTIVIDVLPENLIVGLVLTTDDDLGPVEVQRFEFSDLLMNVRNERSGWHNQLSFTVSQQEALGLKLQGRVKGALAIDQHSMLLGNIDLDFADLAWLESVYPQAKDIVGELYASGKIGGNLQRPLVNAQFKLKDAAFKLPEAGLAMTKINLDLSSDDENTLTLSGSALSGPDSQLNLSAVATTPLLPERSLTMTVAGKNFQVLNTPEYVAAISPDLKLNLVDNVFSVQGEIVVPLVNISLPNTAAALAQNSVDVSSDVIVVAAPKDQASLMAAKSPFAKIPVTADVKLVLGEQVKFQGYGLDLTLAGKLAIEQDLERPLLAYGELLIPRGSYQIYGQALNVQNGKLIFLGNPRNPLLDIRATRATSPGTTTIVGVHLGGSIRNIEGELFSTPSLPDREVLAILVTGKSFGSANAQDGDALLTAVANLGIKKGEGITKTISSGLGLDSVVVSGGANFRESSLGLGKYLAPNLLMRYDIGLFDRQAVLGLEYTLTEHIRLEVETGISQSADLTYTIERN